MDAQGRLGLRQGKGLNSTLGEISTIEIDREAAELLETRAAGAGMSVDAFLADRLREGEAAQLAELERRRAQAEESGAVPHARAAAWLETWGTEKFRPWPNK